MKFAFLPEILSKIQILETESRNLFLSSTFRIEHNKIELPAAKRSAREERTRWSKREK